MTINVPGRAKPVGVRRCQICGEFKPMKNVHVTICSSCTPLAKEAKRYMNANKGLLDRKTYEKLKARKTRKTGPFYDYDQRREREKKGGV